MLGVTYKSAWFNPHRIREAMRVGGLLTPTPMGGEGRIVEADETYHGKTDSPLVSPTRGRRGPATKGGHSGPANKRAIVSLIERGGSVRSFHAGVADKATINRVLDENVSRASRLHTDESRLYGDASAKFAKHQTVKHSAKEYARDDVHTNSDEGVFSIFKHGMRGIYQHCGEKPLHRYLAEYDFRYNHRIKLGFSDPARTVAAIQGAEGKRLTYKKASLAGV